MDALCLYNFYRNMTGYVMQRNGLLKAARFLSARRNISETKTILSFRIKAGKYRRH